MSISNTNPKPLRYNIKLFVAKLTDQQKKDFKAEVLSRTKLSEAKYYAILKERYNKGTNLEPLQLMAIASIMGCTIEDVINPEF
jgi:Cro/C1-type HTH DNA-binding domain